MSLTPSADGYVGLRRFFSANGVYLALVLATMALGPEVRAWLLTNWVVSLAVLLLIEAATVGFIGMIGRRPRAVASDHLFPDNDVERTRIRFGKREDFTTTENIYREWFSPSLSIDDSEYMLVVMRGNHERVVEEFYSDGGKRVVGFYTLWPITRALFEEMVVGKFKEKDFKADMILGMDAPTAEVLYIPEICVTKESRSGARLLRDLVGYVGEYLDSHPSVGAVAAWAYTDVGRSLVKRYGMRQRKKPGGGSTEFYEVSRTDALRVQRPRAWPSPAVSTIRG